jgi:hypothetical protein
LETHFEIVQRLSEPLMEWARTEVAQYGHKALLRPQPSVNRSMAVGRALMEAAIPKDAEYMEDALDAPTINGKSDFGRRLYNLIYNKLSRADANAMFLEGWHTHQHIKYGKKVYDVSRGLAEHLKFTDLKNVMVDMVRLPFRSIYISVPENSGLHYVSQMGGVPEGEVPVFGIYVSELESEPGVSIDKSPVSKVLTPFGVEVIKRASAAFPNSSFRVWRILVIGWNKAGSPYDFTTFSYDLYMPPGMSLDALIAFKMQEMANLPDDVKTIYEASEGLAPTWANLTRWIFNVIAYIAMPDAEVEEGIENREFVDLQNRLKRRPPPPAERDRLKMRLRAMNPQHRIYLARSLKPLEVRERLTGLTKEGQKLVWRLLVSGHWRNQAHGKGFQEHRLIWIKPYWKGPADARQMHPVHAVMPPQEEAK